MLRTALLIVAERNTPAAPPLTEIRRLSVSNCLTSRRLLAPCEAHRNFRRLSAARARQQIRNIHAREQNHQRADCREQCSESETKDLRDVGNEQAGFPRRNTKADVLLRIILRELCGQCLERSTSLRKRHAGLRRPTVKRLFESRLSSQVLPGSIVFAIITGTNISGSYATSVPINSFRRNTNDQ